MPTISSECLTKNKDILNFINHTSDGTGNKLMPMWIENLKVNKETFKQSAGCRF